MQVADVLIAIAFTVLLINWFIDYKINKFMTNKYPTICAHCKAAVVDERIETTTTTQPPPQKVEGYDPITTVAKKMMKEYNMTLQDDWTTSYSVDTVSHKFKPLDLSQSNLFSL